MKLLSSAPWAHLGMFRWLKQTKTLKCRFLLCSRRMAPCPLPPDDRKWEIQTEESFGLSLNLMVMLGLQEKAEGQIHLCVMFKYESSKKIRNQKEVRKVLIFRN